MIQMAKILIVDDEPSNLQLLKQVLQPYYQLIFAPSGKKAIVAAMLHKPNLILLDIMMPDMDGYETCQRLKSLDEVAAIPVIFVTAMTDAEDEIKGFDVGAVDYITKPITPLIVQKRIQTHLSLIRMKELEKTRLEIIRHLGRASEYRDYETGFHIMRMSCYSELLGRETGLGEEFSKLMLNASPMHDVGKIGIPDAILTKPEKLTYEEWHIMRKHPEIGANIMETSHSPLLETARSIALTHHEKWNGSGYPYGLKGDQIPIEGRIVAVADVFDALTSARPYKPKWPVDEAVKSLQQNAGEHFDPTLVKMFIDVLPEVLKIKEQWKEPA